MECNEMAVQKLGYSREELFTLSPADITCEAFIGDLAEVRKTLLAQQHVVYETEYKTKNGAVIASEVSSHLSEVKGKIWVISIARDTSTRQHLERELARIDRLNLVGEMAAAIGHEIRNPMTTVRGFLQMIAESPECEEAHEYLGLMIEELDHANAIITEYLSLAKNKSIQQERKNLNAIIGKIFPLLAAEARLSDQSLVLDLEMIDDLWMDEKEIRHLIFNLVRNAQEAMPSGGKIILHTAMVGEKVVFSVSDSGCGIAEQVLVKLGTPFFTTKDYGVGLGLPVCYSIAARHHATLSIESGLAGTNVRLNFPRSTEAGRNVYRSSAFAIHA
jgi:PAS domain S-box-containing protein